MLACSAGTGGLWVIRRGAASLALGVYISYSAIGGGCSSHSLVSCNNNVMSSCCAAPKKPSYSALAARLLNMNATDCRQRSF